MKIAHQTFAGVTGRTDADISESRQSHCEEHSPVVVWQNLAMHIFRMFKTFNKAFDIKRTENLNS